jgi:transposase-like protein
MADKTIDKKQRAQFIFMTEGKSQKEIAAEVGVSERTIHTWVHQYAWDKLRLAALQAPATIADNICSQLVELQNTIAAREPGNRFPTMQEAEVTRKLITCLEKMKKYPSLSQNMQMLETFRNYVRPLDKDFSRKLGGYTEKFLTGKNINGFAPYQVEYCVDAIAPISPFYEETEESFPAKAVPCPDIDTCLHIGKCHYPDCMEEEQAPPEPLIRYSVSPAVLQLNRAHAFAQSQQQQTGSIPAKTPAADTPGSPAPAADVQTANCQLPTAISGSNPAISQSNGNPKQSFSGSRKQRKQLRELSKQSGNNQNRAA